MFPTLLGALILIAAALILTRRAIQFFKTRGQSACKNCPYSGTCSKRGNENSCVNS